MLKRIGRKIARKLSFRAVKQAAPAPSTKQSKSEPKPLRLSMVVPTYNVEAYIDRFLESVFTQTSHLRSFEVIIVDDGSTDRTAEIVKGWQERYPKHLRYVYQENAGASAARNTGLALAKGTWLFFPDPDDFLDKDYIRKMLKETEQVHKEPLLAVCSNLIFYHEDREAFADTHPLGYRFRNGVVRKSSHELGKFIHLSGATIWWHRESVINSGIKFDAKVKPSFEDAHFVNRIFLASPNRTVSFIPEAKYYYRKRAIKTSQLDLAKFSKFWFSSKLKYGVLDLLEFAKRTLGFVPNFIQRTCFYDVMWMFRHLLDHDERADFLTDDERQEFKHLISAIMSYIDIKTILEFELAGCTEEHRVALLALYKNDRVPTTAVYLQQFDHNAGLIQFVYLSGGNDNLSVRTFVNGREVEMKMRSRRNATFMGTPYFTQHYFWVSMNDGDSIRFEVDGSRCRIRRGGKPLGGEADWITLRNALIKPAPRDVSPEHRRLRNVIIKSQEQYRGCWVLMDRDDRADDNAEHLYRHLMRQGRDSNVWFILNPESRDWGRLEREGFKLLAYGSDDHIAAQMNAAVLASSHADSYVLWPVPKAQYGDLARYEFVFLQHGVLMNDLSSWLNSKPIRLFATTMPKEHAHLTDVNSPYIFTDRETLFGGLPRHDQLFRKAEEIAQDSILIMPTWRQYLTELGEETGMRRTKRDNFLESPFARNWSAVLNSPNLSRLAERHGVKVMFVPHPNMAMYLPDMEIPEWIETVDVRDGVQYQDLLVRAQVAVTDYSSALMEVACLQRPVVYFQFDFNEFFAGEHICRPGYFSFAQDGFGPIAMDPDDVIAQLDKALSGHEDPTYAARRDEAFPFRDGLCCERVRLAIEEISRPRPVLAPDYATLASRPAHSRTTMEHSLGLKLVANSAS